MYFIQNNQSHAYGCLVHCSIITVIIQDLYLKRLLYDMNIQKASSLVDFYITFMLVDCTKMWMCGYSILQDKTGRYITCILEST